MEHYRYSAAGQRRQGRAAFWWISLLVPTLPLFAQTPPALESQATALIAKRCGGCHDANGRTAGLDLSSRQSALKGGKSGPSLDPGHVETSLMAKKIGAGQMPLGNPMSEEERKIIFAWIRAGAPWSSAMPAARGRAGLDWWSLQPLRTGPPPSSPPLPEEWSHSAIDRYLYAALQQKGLHPAPPADRRTLIRRATFDLLGLPPTPEEVGAFVADPRPDAYEHLIDRLLSSPHYGERWGRHWLDVVRFGESHGYEQNHLRDRAWPYRDYVIESFNQDKPFNRMIVEQLAGDQIAPGDPQVEVATGFLVAGVHDTVKIENVEGELNKRANDLDDIVTATGTAFLGLTVNCARCHDHKFDPIKQADYYRMQAVFAGVEHAERPLATAAELERHRTIEDPLRAELKNVEEEITALRKRGEPLVAAHKEEIAARRRPPVDAKGTEETFPPTRARLVRMTISGTFRNSAPALDEIEIWTASREPVNVALASRGALASAASTRSTGTDAMAYDPENLNDGKYDKTWISAESGKGEVTIQLANPEIISRIFWSRDRAGAFQGRFTSQVPTQYKFEASVDGHDWRPLASSEDRLPYDEKERDRFFLRAVLAPGEIERLNQLEKRKSELDSQLAAIPKLRQAYIGSFSQPKEAAYLMKRGNPMDKGEVMEPAGLSTLQNLLPDFHLDANSPEGARRLALARWIADDRNALTARVLANRIWHYHFGHGLVGTPSDFGFNGERPTHPELLDWLARRLQQLGWRLKPFQRELMLSAAYRQSSALNPEASKADTDDRLLWRFPPQRLEAEEVRDAVLAATGKLDTRMGGPGFRLFKYTVDNVATYLPREDFGPDTFRRAVYEQSARSVKDDMLSPFDCPDSSMSEPKRFVTTSPLQALTMLNSSFMIDQARYFSARLEGEFPNDRRAQVDRAFQLAFGRDPQAEEMAASLHLVEQHGMVIFCRALFNANEFIYVM